MIEVLSTSLENWSNSQYSDTDIGKDVCATLQEQIKEAKEEIKAYEEYKATGAYITRRARKVLQESSRENKKIKKKRKKDENYIDKTRRI